MSFRKGKVIVIAPEPDSHCEQCGAIAETRPYGRHGARICRDCGEADFEETQKNMYMRLFGSKLEFTSWQLMKKQGRHFAETVNAILDPLSPVRYVPMRRKTIVRWRKVVRHERAH